MALTTTAQMPPAIPPANACIRRFTVEEYHQLIDIGILTENDPVELLEGWVRYKMPRNPIHDSRIEVTRRVLERLLPAAWTLRDQKAVTLSDSEPEPDLVVAVGKPERYDDHHPGPSEIGLLVEVANTTLDFDRGEKGVVYARQGILVYWIVNLIHRQIEVYTDPDQTANPPRYRNRQDYPIGSDVPVVLRGQQVGTIAVQDIMP